MITGDTKEVGLNGMTSTLSDYDCDDGDLQVCHNMISDGAGLETISDVEVKFTLPVEMEKCVYVHETTAGEVYLVVGTDADIYAYKESDGQLSGVSIENIGSELFRNADEYSISSIGNVLVVSIHKGGEFDGLHYHRWVNDSGGGKYEYLGQAFPDLNIKFWLNGPKRSTASEEYEGTEIDDIISGLLNKVMAYSYEHGMFYRPFFVRYAYRLYDGSFANVSPPVYMVPRTGYNPFVYKIDEADVTPTYHAVVWYAPLYANSNYNEIKERLEKWKEIITSVCIFVSPQITNVNYSGSEQDRIENTEGVEGWAYSSASKRLGEDNEPYGIPYKHKWSDTPQTSDVAHYYCGYTKVGEEKEWIEETYSFFLLHEYALTDTIDGAIKIEHGILKNIETREKLTETETYERALPTAICLHAYNSRLNLSNIALHEKRTFPNGFVSCYMWGGHQYVDSELGTLNIRKIANATITVYIEDGGEYQTAETTIDDSDNWAVPTQWPGYFFYPNVNARYAHFKGTVYEYSDDGTASASTLDSWIELSPHPYLAGAYYYGESIFPILSKMPDEISSWTKVSSFQRRNYLYTSEVDNPFVFPASGVEAIGNGEIVAIKEATKAVSEGTAFGTMPLYAFCTDGIWSLAVGDTGLYSAKQPVSRETLLNDDAGCATQIDNSIVFLSDRGLMELSGGSTRLLSGQLRGRNNIRDAASLPSWSDIHDRFGGGAFMDADDFIGFIKKGGRIAFDYERYRLIIYREDENTAYVYDVGTETWATMASRIKSSLEGFPATLLNLKGDDGRTEVGAFSIETTTPTGGGRAFYLTRPLKLGEADTLKTVRRLVERGVRSGDGTKYLALWGSRDMRTWRLVGAVVGTRMPRLSGTPYKYFIVGGWTQFTEEGERISRLTLESASRYKDKIR